VFDAMRGDESGHRRRLIELYRQKFGEHIPFIRRQDVKGFVPRKPVWLVRPLGLEAVRREASAIEVETRRFYEGAAMRSQDASVRQLLDDLAQEERTHEDRAQELTEEKLRPIVKPPMTSGKLVVGAAIIAPVGSKVRSFSISADLCTCACQRP